MPSSPIRILVRHFEGVVLPCPPAELPELPTLAEVLDHVPDPRRVRGRRHRLGALLALCTVAVLSGATSPACIARFAADSGPDLRRRLGLAATTPVATTLGRLLSRLDGDALDDAVGGSSLVGAVPTAANWKLAGLPKYLTGEQFAALLASCDPATAVGRRDAAILTLLARLGLRAGEVAALKLEDVDWRRAEITVRGKGNRHERLPLPPDVGEAVVTYLSRARPVAATGREVFVDTRAPHRALTRGAITQLVARASNRCGLVSGYGWMCRGAYG